MCVGVCVRKYVFISYNLWILCKWAFTREKLFLYFRQIILSWLQARYKLWESPKCIGGNIFSQFISGSVCTHKKYWPYFLFLWFMNTILRIMRYMNHEIYIYNIIFIFRVIVEELKKDVGTVRERIVSMEAAMTSATTHTDLKMKYEKFLKVST